MKKIILSIFIPCFNEENYITNVLNNIKEAIQTISYEILVADDASTDKTIEMIEKFKKIHPNFIYELQYEKFVEDPEIESKKLLKFCNLPWDKKCLQFFKRKDLISQTASNIQIRKAIYKDSIKKYLPYKQFLNKYGYKYSWFN